MRLMCCCLLSAALLSCNQRTETKAPVCLYEFDLKQLASRNHEFVYQTDKNPLGQNALVFTPASDSSSMGIFDTASREAWIKARYLVADVWNANRYSAIVRVNFFDQDTARSARIFGKMGILPYLKTRLVFPLEYLDGQTFFMARQVRCLKGVVPGHRIAPQSIANVTISLAPVQDSFPTNLSISRLCLMSEMPDPLPPSKPIVDTLGQWMARSWPGKTANTAELVRNMEKLLDDAKRTPLPDQWSSFGGWKKKKVGKGTGFFGVHHDGKRWWLVDPQGYCFFSTGVDCIGPNSSGPVSGMEDLHSWLPPSEGQFAAAYGKRNNTNSFCFLVANLIRSFGDQWERKWHDITKGLLYRWRFNTIGNWSDKEFIAWARMPYVLPLSGFPETKIHLYRDFPDVFDTSYRAAADSFARQIAAYKDDPYLIGYFLRNEPLWAFGENNIAAEMIAIDTSSSTRKAFVRWLRDRYRNSVVGLNQAWHSQFTDFSELNTRAINDADRLSPAAKADLWDFSGLMVEKYLQYPSEALRKIDSHHLNLGIRYGTIESDLCYRGLQYFDVFSLNSYTERPDSATIMKISTRAKKPVMIGEFHFGSIDRGLPSTGLGAASSQEQRGVAYRYYVEQGAKLPALVGVHYFQLNDQPVLGRSDGENYNIGFVDICNMPYTEMLAGVQETNEDIYEIASGARKAFSTRADSIPKIFF